jgi:glycosyltransferase involved in cell wall biosynthesis
VGGEPASAPLRVLTLLAGAPQGGAETFAVRLTVSLARAGMDVAMALRPQPDRLARLAAAGVPAVRLPFGPPALDLFTRWGVRRTADRFRPDVVLSFMNRASAFAPRGPWVNVGRLGGYYPLRHYGRCDHLVGISPDICAHIRAGGWPADRVHHIPNFAEGTPMPAIPRAEFATPDGVPLLLALGRLHPNKAFDVLLDAVAALPGTWLWLAGEGPERDALTAQARRLGIADRVRLLGWRTDIGALFAAADAFVVPSRHEPLGSVLMEGFFYGRPMVAAASQGPRQVVSDGEDGLLVPVDDAPALAAALSRVLSDRALAARLVDAGRRTYAERYAEPVIVGAYRDLFGRIVAERG